MATPFPRGNGSVLDTRCDVRGHAGSVRYGIERPSPRCFCQHICPLAPSVTVVIDAQSGAEPGAIFELWPRAGAVDDPFARNFELDRTRPDGAPWVAMVMISTLDGAAEVDGVSGGLGAPSDKTIFGAMRSIADAIVVAGGTARDEDYGPPIRRERVLELRRARSQADVGRLAVLSGSLSFDPDAKLFASAAVGAQPLIYTASSSDPTHASRRDKLASRAEIVDLDSVTPQTVVDDLAARGCRVVVLEGGPSLNGQFLAADMVDEIHLSLAPLAVGGDAIRIARGMRSPDPRRFSLARLWAGDGILFASYHRSDPNSDSHF